MNLRRVRDLILINIDGNKTLVIACDSCGGAGSKENDVVKVPPVITGKYTARVPLLEVMCSGAKVMAVIDNLCCEMKPTGEEIIKGIKIELEAAGLQDVALGGSTEENLITSMTALGMNVIGIAENTKLKVNNIKGTGILYSIGIPKVGVEVNLERGKDFFTYDILNKLIDLEGVYEIVPVGSKGILYEAKELAKNNEKSLFLADEIEVDINKSAGPSTVAIVCIEENLETYIKKIPFTNKIGILK